MSDTASLAPPKRLNPQGAGEGVKTSFFKIFTYHGGVFGTQGPSWKVFACDPTSLSANQPGLILYRPAKWPGLGFLMAQADKPVRLLLEHTDWSNEVIPLRIADHGPGQPCSFFVPSTGAWLCALPHTPEQPSLIAADRTVALSFEQYTLQSLSKIMLPSAVLKSVEHLDWWLHQWMPNQPALMEGLTERLSQPGFVSALGAVIQLLPRSRAMRLAQVLMAEPSFVAFLPEAAPGDLFASHGVPQLSALNRGAAKLASPDPARGSWLPWKRRPSAKASAATEAPWAPVTLGPEMDPLASLGWNGNPTSLAHKLTLLTRAGVKPSKDVCILATARNEGLYTLDWIAYHRAIGFDDIFLYTNDNDDGSDALLEALDRSGIIHWRNSLVSSGGNAQAKAYGHALQLSPELLQFRWVLIIDLDEFFGFDPNLFTGIKDFLDWHETREVDAIAMNWVFHGSAEQARWQSGFMPRRFPVALGGPDRHIKTMFRPNRFIHSGPHYPWAPEGASRIFRAASGRKHIPDPAHNEFAFSADPVGDKAWISHFFYKSAEEFLLKWSRNRGDYPTQAGMSNKVLPANFVLEFMHQYPILGPNLYNIDLCAPTFDSVLQSLQALPGVSDAFGAITTAHHARMPAIQAMFEEAPGILAAGASGQALMATLQP